MPSVRSISLCLRRVDPSLFIDLCVIGTVQDGQFTPLIPSEFDAILSHLASIGHPDLIRRSDISNDSYILHGSVKDLFGIFRVESVDWFQNTLVFVFPFDFKPYEPSQEEK